MNMPALFKKWRYLMLILILLASWVFISAAPTPTTDTPIVEVAAPKARTTESGTSSEERIDSLQLERLKRTRANANKMNLFPAKS